MGFSPHSRNQVTVTEATEEVMTCLKEQAADFYNSGIQKLVPRLNKCWDNAGDYFER
jgi:hypothetical protein